MVIQFVIGTTVVLLTEPITLGSAVSLFSKLLEPEVQGKNTNIIDDEIVDFIVVDFDDKIVDINMIFVGIGHGLRRSLVSLGGVIGSLWAAAALQPETLLFLYGVPTVLLIIATVR